MKVEPRKPTDEEKGQLAICLSANADMAIEEAIGNITDAAIAVFDHYVTVAPGYSGKIMMVVWQGGPEFHDVYIWTDNRVERVRSEFA